MLSLGRVCVAFLSLYCRSFPFDVLSLALHSFSISAHLTSFSHPLLSSPLHLLFILCLFSFFFRKRCWPCSPCGIHEGTRTLSGVKHHWVDRSSGQSETRSELVNVQEKLSRDALIACFFSSLLLSSLVACFVFSLHMCWFFLCRVVLGFWIPLVGFVGKDAFRLFLLLSFPLTSTSSLASTHSLVSSPLIYLLVLTSRFLFCS